VTEAISEQSERKLAVGPEKLNAGFENQARHTETIAFLVALTPDTAVL
jgi:hypothetical protein